MDLTEKLELVDQLETERAKLATILDTALSAIVVADEQGCISYANPAAQKLHGQPMPQARGPRSSHRRMGLYHPDGTPYEPRDLPLVRSALYGRDATPRWSFSSSGRTARRRHILVNTRPLGEPERKDQRRRRRHPGHHRDQGTRSRPCANAHDKLEEQVQERTAELDAAVDSLQEQVVEKIEAQNKLMHQNEVLQKIVNNIPGDAVLLRPRGPRRHDQRGFHRASWGTPWRTSARTTWRNCASRPRSGARPGSTC